jgi:thiamine pyrophosphate-dependent acetolactate synthase large subunit-like protein
MSNAPEPARYREGLRCRTILVDQVGQIDEALEWSFEQSGPTLVDFRIA